MELGRLELSCDWYGEIFGGFWFDQIWSNLIRTRGSLRFVWAWAILLFYLVGYGGGLGGCTYLVKKFNSFIKVNVDDQMPTFELPLLNSWIWNPFVGYLMNPSLNLPKFCVSTESEILLGGTYFCQSNGLDVLGLDTHWNKCYIVICLPAASTCLCACYFSLVSADVQYSVLVILVLFR